MDTRMMIRSYEAAVAALDVDALIGLYAADARVFDAASAWEYTSRDKWRGAVEAWFGGLSGGGVCEMRDVATTSGDALAVVSGFVRYAADTPEGERADMSNRLTQVWERRGDDWKIVHEHSSLPLDNEMERPLPQP